MWGHVPPVPHGVGATAHYCVQFMVVWLVLRLDLVSGLLVVMRKYFLLLSVTTVPSLLAQAYTYLLTYFLLYHIRRLDLSD